MMDGQTYINGKGNGGQLCINSGRDTRIPTLIPNLVDVRACDGGTQHTVFALEDGTVKGCGKNQKGELGTGDKSARLTPAEIPSFSEVAIKAVCAGSEFTAFVMEDSTVGAWTSHLSFVFEYILYSSTSDPARKLTKTMYRCTLWERTRSGSWA